MINLRNEELQIVVGGGEVEYNLSKTCKCIIKNKGFGGFTAKGDDDCTNECAALAKRQMAVAAAATVVGATCFGAACVATYNYLK